MDNTVVRATNAYTLMTAFAFPIARQQLLSEHYPFFVANLIERTHGMRR